MSSNNLGIIVGYDAIPNLSMHPDRTIFNAKRFIGKRFTAWFSSVLLFPPDLINSITRFSTYLLFIFLPYFHSSLLTNSKNSLNDSDVQEYAESHPFMVINTENIENFSSTSNGEKISFIDLIMRIA